MSLSLAQRRKTTQHPASNAIKIWLRCLQSDELLTDVILGTSGLGLETCRQPLKHDATVYFIARNLDRAEVTRKDIVGGHIGESNANLHVVHMDLSDLESIKKGADSFKAGLNRFDVLIINAGIMATQPSTTKEFYEIQFGTNHMGHALLTKLLMPKPLETASKPDSDVRVVNLSSAGHGMPQKGGLVLQDVKSDMASTNTWVRYGQAKTRQHPLHSRTR